MTFFFPNHGRPRLGGAARAGLVVGLVLLSAGCLHRRKSPPTTRRVPAPAPYPAPTKPSAGPAPIVQGEEGIASWYGHPYHGRRTANGEVYNMYAMTAAHRTLPFNTQVRVHNLKNGQETVVRINDRGPFVEGRIIDLSYAAAMAIRAPSISPVRLEILNLSASGAEPGAFAVQVGSFRDPQNAERLKGVIEPRLGPVTIQTFDRGDGIFYRVRVGREQTEEAALGLARSLRQANLAAETFVVRVD